jgi:two-component system KDP operon response regulator KdpE
LSKILIVDDDRDLLNACTVGLEALGHEVHTVVNGSEGLSTVAVEPPDVMVLDLGLPDLDGVEVCRRIRKWTDLPIIILSADGTEDRKVEALDNGADDYMTKPFGMRELDARVRATLRHRRNVDEQSTELDVGLLHIDLVHHEAIYDGGRLDLTPKEFEFLAYLSRHVGKVCTRRMILENVWGPGYEREQHYLKVYAYRIRRKLGDERGRFLQSDPSVGYRLVPPTDGR